MVKSVMQNTATTMCQRISRHLRWVKLRTLLKNFRDQTNRKLSCKIKGAKKKNQIKSQENKIMVPTNIQKGTMETRLEHEFEIIYLI
jgi:hypothetical protein